MLNNGDKLVVTKTVATFLKEGDTVKVVDVSENGIISFAFGDGFCHMGVMSAAECEEHFEKVTEETGASRVTWELVEEIMENSEFEIQTVFNKCTVVSCRLPNGFVIVESSACVNPENYDEEIGADICFDKIADKIFELEAYKLQDKMNTGNYETQCYHNCHECDECPCDKEFFDEDDEEDDECFGNCCDCDDFNFDNSKFYS